MIEWILFIMPKFLVHSICVMDFSMSKLTRRMARTTSFVRNIGPFPFRYVSFGSPSVLMRYAVYRDLIAQSTVLPCMDDLVVLTTNEPEMLESLTTDLVRLWTRDKF